MRKYHERGSRANIGIDSFNHPIALCVFPSTGHCRHRPHLTGNKKILMRHDFLVAGSFANLTEYLVSISPSTFQKGRVWNLQGQSLGQLHGQIFISKDISRAPITEFLGFSETSELCLHRKDERRDEATAGINALPVLRKESVMYQWLSTRISK
jgi:hypothetical protein